MISSNKTVNFIIKNSKAEIPTKAHKTDIGYDLTAISVYKKMTDKVTLYETGIAVRPPEGYYLEIIPRSSISKTGYMLVNSIGIIDPDYTGTLKIPLCKIDDEMPDIKLPFKRCQLVLRKAEMYNMEETENINETERGDKGFGSSDKN
jgi:dUTP pyrophosphatase